ncbi:MAG: pilus assembly protein N-terminal domain-containing protein [Isosphaeraceae bacterium]
MKTEFRHQRRRDRRMSRAFSALLGLACCPLLSQAGLAQTTGSGARIITPTPDGAARRVPMADPTLPALPGALDDLDDASQSGAGDVEPRVITPPGGPARGAVPPPPAPGQDIPRVLTLEPSAPHATASASPPRVLDLRRDSTGLIPPRPPRPPPPPGNQEVSKDVSSMIESIQGSEGEIAVVMGESKIIRTRKPLTRVVIANPAVADVELLADQPEPRLLNLFGKSFGNTNLTLWDEHDRPVSFLVRVTLDTKELEGRINQTFPGAQVKVRQIGPQLVLDGQVPDSKMMSDILQVVQATVRNSGGIRTAGGGAGAGGVTGGAAMGGGMGGGMAAGGATGGGITIINRVVVPGPRQVLLHVRIAELNRGAIRQLGINWLNTRGESIIGSTIGSSAPNSPGAGNVGATGAASHSTGAANPIGFLSPVVSAFTANGASTSGGTLFGVFDSGHFSLFINALRQNALAKVLAEPNLVAMDGQPARFLVGGVFPFPVPQSSSIPGGTAVVTVQFRRFGTILNFIPNILPNDVVRLDVEPVVSRLNFVRGTDVNGGRVPSIDERSARTIVELREGQTLAIAGLLQLETNATSSRIPGLGDLPLVGPWFSDNRIETVETETIILVTPELVSPLEKNEVTEAPGDRVYQPSDAEFYFLGRIEGKLGREFRATVAEQDPLNLMKHFQSEQQWVAGPHGYAD